MSDLKISLITVTFNTESTIERCIRSVINQTYKNVEYIIIDGVSTDKTGQVINKYKKYINYFLSEPDRGIYDAMNKALAVATGSIVGMLNADDWFTDGVVLGDIAKAFTGNNIEILYGDLDYVDERGKILRKWRSGIYKPGAFNWGWMPPHPTFYCKRELFEKYGCYRLDLGTAADYELMLRFIHKHQVVPYYLNKIMVKMQSGGASNENTISRLRSLKNDLKAMRINGISFPLLALAAKPLRKIGQYF